MKAVLLSGGMDSVALTYWKRPELAITVDYGQVCAEAEIEAAMVVAASLRMQHEIIRVNCRALGSGDLAGTAVNPLGASREWWPYRNQLLITLAAIKALESGTTELLIATVKSDENYRDGTADFVRRIDSLLALQEGELHASAPAIGLTTEQLVRQSQIPFELLAWAHSCHCSNLACGDCRGCYKHQQAMEALGHGHY
jgi:7-cyano-7-deazaguanine synthase